MRGATARETEGETQAMVVAADNDRTRDSTENLILSFYRRGMDWDLSKEADG
jgi:hypothetical protein